MTVEPLFRCLSDLQRIRMLNLLIEGPLCVCHLMDILESEQVKVSKQLRYMKTLQVVEAERHAQWRIYRVSDGAEPLLKANLDSLRSDSVHASCLQEDLCKRETIVKRIQETGAQCPDVVLNRSCST